MSTEIEISSQPGPQDFFLASSADICIYGGAAGGGKTYGLLLEPLNYILDVDGFGAVIFRRTTPQITNEGGLWDTAERIYPLFQAYSKLSTLEWVFPNGNRLKFAHLEYEQNVLDWQGSQIPLLCFDELTHFTEKQFFYLMSRNRSVCGVRPYIRATTNPDSDSWVAKFISWWLDENTGFPIYERSGVIRWFIRVNGKIIWADTDKELVELHPGSIPKSVTFIPAKLSDNIILEKADPSYRANLRALDYVDNERLEKGNWKIREEAGTMFQEGWFNVIDRSEIPYNPQDLNYVRWWDAAATAQSKDSKNPDWCSGVLMAEAGGNFYILDVIHFREDPAGVYEKIEFVRDLDGKTIDIGMEQEGGSAAKREIDTLKKTMFKGFSFYSETSSGNKVIRSKLFSAACKNGLVYIVRAPWNYDFIQELVNFPNPKWHDDQVDSASGAFNYLAGHARNKKFDIKHMFPSKKSTFLTKIK